MLVPSCIGVLVELGLMARTGFAGLPGIRHVTSCDMREIVLPAFDGKARSTIQTMRGGSLCVSERANPLDDANWTAFQVRAQRTAEHAGINKKVAQQLIGAMGELEDNIHLHSRAVYTGFVGYRAYAGEFEFVIADQGVGVLESLRTCDDYKHLKDSGKALLIALQEGESRFGRAAGRGSGFRPLFTGLANLMGQLRFRSGDHVLTIDGQHPDLAAARVQQRAPFQGFVATVRCRNPA